tara:strand:- start:1974 stop:2975 length:1002 start_codon:yes stop_codon:yes gene_type:complete
MKIENKNYNLAEDLHTKATLVKARATIWGATKDSPELTQAVASDVKGNADWFKVRKNLIDLTPIKEMRKLDRQRKNEMSYQTCVWDSEWRLLPNENRGIYNEIWNDFKGDFDSLRDSLIKDLPDLKAQAKIELGSAFDENLYPTKDEIIGGTVSKQIGGTSANPIYKTKTTKGLIHTEFSNIEIPTIVGDVSDERINDRGEGGIKNLLGEVSNYSISYWDNKLVEVAERNQEDLISGISEVVISLSEFNPQAETGKKKPFRDSKIPNLRKTLTGLKGRNEIFNDERVEEIIKACETALGKSTSESLRESSEERKTVTKELSKELKNSQDIFGV